MKYIGEHSPNYFPAKELGIIKQVLHRRCLVVYSFGFLYPLAENLEISGPPEVPCVIYGELD